ncbi:hypothetical protein [Azospirillum largimobile]
MKNYAKKVALAPDDVRRAIVYAAISPTPSARLDPAMPSLDRINFMVDPVKSAKNRLKMVLFPWMVDEFRGKPTKTKAICIFDMFLADGKHKDENFSRLSGRMDTIRQDSELAKSMSWFKRVATSSSRKVDANIFDDMYRIHMLGKSNDSLFIAAHQDLFRQILSTPPTMSLSSEISAVVRGIRQACETAGFPLKKLGLTDSFA